MTLYKELAVVAMMAGRAYVNSSLPIVGFNYGAKQYHRAVKTFQLTVWCATAACAIGFLSVMTVPELITRAFTNDPTVIALTVPAMRICCAMMLLMGFQVVTSNFFQSLWPGLRWKRLT